jgi:hypothetical protein
VFVFVKPGKDAIAIQIYRRRGDHIMRDQSQPSQITQLFTGGEQVHTRSMMIVDSLRQWCTAQSPPSYSEQSHSRVGVIFVNVHASSHVAIRIMHTLLIFHYPGQSLGTSTSSTCQTMLL